MPSAVPVTFKKSCLTSLALTFQICKKKKKKGEHDSRISVFSSETCFKRNNNQVVGSSGEGTRDMIVWWGLISTLKDSPMGDRCELVYIVPEGRKRIRR